MPAKDKYHDTVVRALQKDGWVIEQEQMRLVVEDRYVYLDFQARKTDTMRIIVVEVKGFENAQSYTSYLADVLGQYFLYRHTMNYLNMDYPLYLAVPHTAYETLLQEEMSQNVVRAMQMPILTFDPDSEEIVQWID